KSIDPDEVIAEADPDEIVTVIKREWEPDKRIDLLRGLLHDLTPSEIVTAVMEALDNDKAAQSVAVGITKQLETPKESRRRLEPQKWISARGGHCAARPFFMPPPSSVVER